MTISISTYIYICIYLYIYIYIYTYTYTYVYLSNRFALSLRWYSKPQATPEPSQNIQYTNLI